MVKTENLYKLGTKFLYNSQFLEGKTWATQMSWHTFKVTSELIIDPTNVIASDPQVWLLALKGCKIFFDILFFIFKLLKFFSNDNWGGY